MEPAIRFEGASIFRLVIAAVSFHRKAFISWIALVSLFSETLSVEADFAELEV